jgi:SNF2-related domain
MRSSARPRSLAGATLVEASSLFGKHSASTLESGRSNFVPRPHQVAACTAILAARAEGRPGFLLGDLTGLGKTLSVWTAVAAMPEEQVLIVCPKGGMPQWRRTIALSGLPPKSVTLINYERIKSLFKAPPASTKRSVRAKNNELARHGRPKRTWPIVVFDESHRLRNPYAQQSMACRQLADAASFSIFVSATAGQSPHELSYLGRLLGHAAGCPTETLADFRVLMRTAPHRSGERAMEELVVATERARPSRDVGPALQRQTRHWHAPTSERHRGLARGAARTRSNLPRTGTAQTLRRNLARVQA